MHIRFFLINNLIDTNRKDGKYSFITTIDMD